MLYTPEAITAELPGLRIVRADRVRRAPSSGTAGRRRRSTPWSARNARPASRAVVHVPVAEAVVLAVAVAAAEEGAADGELLAAAEEGAADGELLAAGEEAGVEGAGELVAAAGRRGR